VSSCVFKANLVKMFLSADCPADKLTTDTKKLVSQLDLLPSFEVQLYRLDEEESLDYTAGIGLNPGECVGTRSAHCTLGLFLNNKGEIHVFEFFINDVMTLSVSVAKRISRFATLDVTGASTTV